MARAAYSGKVDFSRADVHDRKWWLRLNQTLDMLEQDMQVDVFTRQHEQHMAVMSYELAKETFDHHWRDANRLLSEIHTTHFPWLAKSKEPLEEYKSIFDEWKANYGDYSDPKVRDKYHRLAEHMAKKRTENKANTKTPAQRTKEGLKKINDRRRRNGKRR